MLAKLQQRAFGKLVDAVSIQLYTPLVRPEQTHRQSTQDALARSAGSHHVGDLAQRELGAQVSEHWTASDERLVHMVEDQLHEVLGSASARPGVSILWSSTALLAGPRGRE